MALENWVDKQDGIDDILAEDINSIANAVIETQEEINKIVIDQTYAPTSENAQSGKAVAEAVSDKQDSLVSGTNIKTINNQSILGSGNITIEGGSDVEVDQNYNPESENAQSGKAVNEAVAPKLDKPDSDGTTGQILGLDDNLLPAWIVPRQRFFKKIASYTVSETGISSVQMTIPAKTRIALVTGITNTSQTFGGIIVRFISFTSESMLAQSTNLSLSHRECSCCVMFGDDIIGTSGVSANNNITLLVDMLPYKKNYLDYIDRNDNNIRIQIQSSSTITEFPERATFDLYVVTED